MKCPDCGGHMMPREGCFICTNCGKSECKNPKHEDFRS